MKRKKLKISRKNLKKSRDMFKEILYSKTRNKQESSSEGRREYRKGKQEYHITLGNRIREIEMPHKLLDA